MKLPLGIILLAAGAGAVVAYGTNPALVQAPHGIALILLSRRLQWPLVTLSLLLSLALIALVVYDKRLGQFVNGLTGRTMARQKPTGFVAPLPSGTMTWKKWRELAPETKVMAPVAGAGMGPSVPLPPAYPVPPAKSASPL